MSRLIKFATVQPPAWVDRQAGRTIADIGLELFDQAAAGRPDVICLPEYFNCLDCAPAEYTERCGPVARGLLQTLAERARANRCYVILPLVIDADGRRFNRAHLLGRDGRLIGHFDKVHVTAVEREDMGVEAGSTWPVYDTDFGRVGMMICYDGCFPEPARLLALAGARTIFWPSLQRSYSRNDLELQMRSHAYFNYATIVRSSYGGPMSAQPGAPCMVGLSGVCGEDGTMLTSLASGAGWTEATVDVGRELRGTRTFGGELGSLRQMRFEDRRPDQYGGLTQTWNGDTLATQKE